MPRKTSLLALRINKLHMNISTLKSRSVRWTFFYYSNSAGAELLCPRGSRNSSGKRVWGRQEAEHWSLVLTCGPAHGRW